MGAFETSEAAPNRNHQPVRVPISKENIFGAAKEMCDDLDSWNVVSTDDKALTITCEKQNGFLGGTSRIVVTVDGPDGIPSSTTSVRSESSGALLSRDKGNVAEFIRKFSMRVV